MFLPLSFSFLSVAPAPEPVEGVKTFLLSAFRLCFSKFGSLLRLLWFLQFFLSVLSVAPAPEPVEGLKHFRFLLSLVLSKFGSVLRFLWFLQVFIRVDLCLSVVKTFPLLLPILPCPLQTKVELLRRPTPSLPSLCLCASVVQLSPFYSPLPALRFPNFHFGSFKFSSVLSVLSVVKIFLLSASLLSDSAPCSGFFGSFRFLSVFICVHLWLKHFRFPNFYFCFHVIR